MLNSWLRALGSLLVYAGPFIGFYVVLRRPNRTRRQLVLGAAIGGGLPALLWAVAFAIADYSQIALIPWSLTSFLYGAFIGVCGVLAMNLGRWLSRPQS